MSPAATISRQELREKIDAGAPFYLFEVLAEPYYRRHHLPGARLMLPSGIEAAVRDAGVPADAEIVVYCWDDH